VLKCCISFSETLLMRKIHLSIRRPCYEDWDAMTPSDKGRFCASCQKAVVDFTSMSDRQLVEFFKKPPSAVCGRVYNDQLNRDIIMTKKRIPWIRYFFQFAWPAFTLFLKSCGIKDNTKGEVKVELRTDDVQERSFATVGFMIPEITPFDTSGIMTKESVAKGKIVGDVDMTPITDSVELPADSSVEDGEITYKPMDTVFVQSYGATTGKIILAGAISICKVETIQQDKDSVGQETTFDNEIKFKAYPNPIRAGSLLNLSFEDSDIFPEVIQIVSSTGQLISQLKLNSKATVTNIQVPSNIAAGVYFLRLITKNKQVKTTKIIVTKG
jgi:hypothetical protein